MQFVAHSTATTSCPRSSMHTTYSSSVRDSFDSFWLVSTTSIFNGQRIPYTILLSLPLRKELMNGWAYISSKKSSQRLVHNIVQFYERITLSVGRISISGKWHLEYITTTSPLPRVKSTYFKRDNALIHYIALHTGTCTILILSVLFECCIHEHLYL